MRKAVIYARYSSDSQTEQSIEGQLRVCREYAQTNDILIVDTYIDRAMTGTNDMRPDFQRMLKDSAKHQWEVVLVYKLDRFSRDKYETTIHKHTLKENGVKLVSAISVLIDKVIGILHLSPNDIKDTQKASNTIKQILGNLRAIATGIASLRNPYGSGHGKSASFKGLQERHAKLAIGSSLTLVNFLWDSYEFQKETLKRPNDEIQI